MSQMTQNNDRRTLFNFCYEKNNKTTILCVEPFLTSIVKVKVVLRLCCET